MLVGVRVAFWNILHGGGRRVPEIALRLLETGADVVALAEFRPGRGGQLRAVLADHGLTEQMVSVDADAGGRRNGLLLASRVGLADRVVLCAGCLGARVGGELELTVCHVPDGSGGRAQERRRAEGWRAVLDRAGVDQGMHGRCSHLIIGDLNAGKAGVDGPAVGDGPLRRAVSAASGERIGRLKHLGFSACEEEGRAVDAGSELSEIATWRGPMGRGMRLDHAFFRGGDAPCMDARLRVERRVMDASFSDHALLVVDLEPASAGASGVSKGVI